MSLDVEAVTSTIDLSDRITSSEYDPTKSGYMLAQGRCLEVLSERGKYVEGDPSNHLLESFSQRFSEVFESGIFEASAIDLARLSEKFSALTPVAKAKYAEAKMYIQHWLMEKDKITDIAEYISEGYEVALKVFFCGEAEDIETLQAGHPSKIAASTENAACKADPNMLKEYAEAP